MLAILISIALIQTALAVPTWWVALTISALMNIPVALLVWAQAPRWVIPLPLVAILGVLAFMLSAVAVEQHRRLQHLRRERDNASQTLRLPESEETTASTKVPAAPQGWWDAPAVEERLAGDPVGDIEADNPVDGQRSSERNTDRDSQEFDELIRRNFAD
ncbi:hypothetical protein [Rhodococcus zopfii]|uniref:hypothetical protein n=1 Tax=Rhodococcus zopfii TaxID=43772 RepID=UPI001114EC1E|nr:hypothetical protein [Rhodococcus zopfii]